MLLFVTVMDLENLLDAMVSNPITLILWKILLSVETFTVGCTFWLDQSQ